MGPFRRRSTAKKQKKGRRLSVPPPSPSVKIMNDARNYAKDYPVRSSRNSKPLYNIIKKVDCATKKRGGRSDPRLTYWLKQEILRFLSDAVINPTKYGRGALDMGILKADLLIKLNSLKRGGSLMINNDCLSTWLKHSTFTSVLRELGNDQVAEDSSPSASHQTPSINDDASSSVSTRSNLPNGSNSGSSSSAAVTTPASPASQDDERFSSLSPISTFSQENEPMSNLSTNHEGQVGFTTPGSKHSQDINILDSSTPSPAAKPLKPLPKLVPAIGLHREMNGENVNSDSSNDNVANHEVIANVGSEEIVAQEGSNESTMHLQSPGEEIAATGSSSVIHTTEDGVPPHVLLRFEVTPGLQDTLYQNLELNAHANIREFCRRLREATFGISQLYQEMILQQGHVHTSFQVFGNLLNNWISFVENYMNPSYW